MTRGTAILLMSRYALTSIEFNGDMYPDGYGDDFMNKLSKVNNEDEFDNFISDFNDLNFQYDENSFSYAHPNEALLNKDNILDLYNFSSAINSDWIFFKNLSGATVKFVAEVNGKMEFIDVENNETIRFNYYRFPTKGIHNLK